MPPDAIERFAVAAIKERGKPGNGHVDANCTPLRHALLHLALSLDRHTPFAAGLALGDIPHRSQSLPAIAIAQPAEFGQKQAVMGLVDLDLFRVGVAEAIGLAFFFLKRGTDVGPFGEKVAVRPLQVLECLLQRMNRCIGQPCRFHAVK